MSASGGPGDSQPAVWYYLQDGNFNVAAATDAAGQVARQHAWEPYGQVGAADAVALPDPYNPHRAVPLPVNRVGHQGLFFERFC